MLVRGYKILILDIVMNNDRQNQVHCMNNIISEGISMRSQMVKIKGSPILFVQPDKERTLNEKKKFNFVVNIKENIFLTKLKDENPRQ